MHENILQVSFFGSTKVVFEQLTKIILEIPIPVKLNHIKSKPKLAGVIENNQTQLIIGYNKENGFGVFEIAQLVQEMQKDIPTLGLYNSDEISVAEAMEWGLNDYINDADKKHLQWVLQRELKYSQYYQITSSEKALEKDFTGIDSRLQFVEQLKELLPGKIANSTICAILYLQLDNFSWINESIGILAGDSFLQDTAIIIKSQVDSIDIAARYQGGSFIMYVEGTDIDDITAKADRIREAIGQATSDIDENTISSSCSIGIRLITDSYDELPEIISNAFEASDRAKGGGGDALHLYKDLDEASRVTKEKHAWNSRIREAFDKDLFQLFFQPIVSLKGDIKPRYEVLLRMIDEKDNVIPPGVFLPFAERAGLMADIDRRVIIHALEKVLEEEESGNEIEVFIKLSAKTLDDKTMPGWIANAFKDVRIKNQNIVFEITESLALTHLSQTRRIADSLKSLNCKLAIDHFGTRVKSLKLLKMIDADYLKIDGSLVANLQTSKAHQTIVRKICKLANAKNIQIMAESVQDVNNLPVIWQYGFDFVQGYFLQVPANKTDYDFSNLLI